MNVQDLTKCTLKQMEYKKDDLVIQIFFPSANLIADKNVILKLVERKTGKEINFSLKKISSIDNMVVFETIFAQTFFYDLLVNGEFWDFVVGIDTEEPKWDRIQSNFAELELLFYAEHQLGKMLVPYTTNKGNLSFKSEELAMIASLENADLSEENILSLSGYVFDPLSNDVKGKVIKNIIIRGNDDVFETRIPIKDVIRKDLTEKYGHHHLNYDSTGFEVEIDVTKFLKHIDDKISLKAYVEIFYTENGEQIKKESPPLKYPVSDRKFVPKSMTVKSDNGKKLIRLSRTKKARNLSISIGDYQFKQEVKTKVRKNFIKIRRHSNTKKLYQKAFKFIGRFPAKKNLVMFESFLGKQYSDSPRALYEYLRVHHPQYKMYWSVDKKFVRNFENRDIQYIRRFSVKWLFAMARAKYWVTNSRMPLWIPKPKSTVYLQTWHGTPLKRLVADMEEVHMPGTTTQKYKENFTREAANWDYLVSPNAYSSEIFRRAFQFNKEMIESGYPRNDYLYTSNNPKTITQIKKTHDIPLDKKVILYAPTWRDDQFYGKGKYKFDLDLDLQLLREKLGDSYVIILRMHYLVAENFDLTPYSGFAFDFSNHEDIRELYLISDLLITDYSSVFFDYANLRRPMIFYVYDIDTYRDKLRGFYFDFEEQAPGPLVKTTEQVIETIETMETEGFKLPASFEPFYEKFCYLESGQSSKKVVEKVFKI